MPLTQVQPGMLGTPQPYNFKNRIINGAMVIDQRNAGASVSANTNFDYTLDRWRALASVNSKYTVQQDAGAVTPPAGFTDYLGVTSSSAYSAGAAEIFGIAQYVEGYNLADLNWGTANAKTVTLSFWVRSSLTGTFGGAFRNNAANRSYPFTYTINSANTWEFETITIPGDTTGTWLTTNGRGVEVQFSLGTGTTYQGTANSWSGGNFLSATGATSVVGTNGATFYITGVQLEVGVTATGFDYRPYGTELQLCQRYFYKVTGATGNNYMPIATGVVSAAATNDVSVPLPVTMRATPTASFTGVIYCFDGIGYPTLSSIIAVFGGFNNVYLAIGTSGGSSAGRPAFVYTINASTGSFSLSAEL